VSLNVVQFPASNLNDIPLMARRFADDVEAGEYGAVEAVVIVAVTDGGIVSLGWGDADSRYKVIGMLEAGKFMHLDGE
jgi:hypothetical protein